MFSRSVFTAFTVGLAAVASAYTTPVGNPSGNPISLPGLNSIVPAGKPYTITWNPTTTGTIALVLLRGPSTNVVPIATIVDGIANSGTYVWTPSTSLEPDVTHYGIQLIVDGTGQYQYTTQFGISNPAYVSSSSSSVVATSTSATSSASSKSVISAESTPCTTTSSSLIIIAASTPCTTSTASLTPIYSANSTTYSFVGTGTGYSTYVASTGYPVSNHSIILPTKSMSVPSSLLTTATYAAGSGAATTPAQATGAAGHVKAGLGLVGAIAGLVMVL